MPSLPRALALDEILFPPRKTRAWPRTWLRRWWSAAAVSTVLVAIALDYPGPRFASTMAADFARRGFTLTERLLTETRVVVYS